MTCMFHVRLQCLRVSTPPALAGVLLVLPDMVLQPPADLCERGGGCHVGLLVL